MSRPAGQPPDGSRRHRRRFKLLLSLGILLVPLAVFEIGQRVSDARKSARRSQKSYSLRPETTDGTRISDKPGGLVLQLHPHLVYRMKPNQRLERVTVNPQGYRGTAWRRERQPGVRRVMLLGGSTAFGHGASSDDHTPAAIMEATLNARTGERWEVLNAAVMTYDSRQELVQLTTELLDYAPDWVVTLDGWNDFYHAGLETPGRPLFHLLHRDVETALRRGRDRVRGLIAWSALYRGIERKLDRRQQPERAFGRYADRPDSPPAYGANLRRICRAARTAGARCLLAVQPELFARRGSIPTRERDLRAGAEADGYAAYAKARYASFVMAAQRAARTESAAFADVTSMFDQRADVYFTDRVHLNNAGSRLLGEDLATRLLGARRQP